MSRNCWSTSRHLLESVRLIRDNSNPNLRAKRRAAHSLHRLFKHLQSVIVSDGLITTKVRVVVQKKHFTHPSSRNSGHSLNRTTPQVPCGCTRAPRVVLLWHQRCSLQHNLVHGFGRLHESYPLSQTTARHDPRIVQHLALSSLWKCQKRAWSHTQSKYCP